MGREAEVSLSEKAGARDIPNNFSLKGHSVNIA